jgi:DNA-binding GntR family transcriptional regulator
VPSGAVAATQYVDPAVQVASIAKDMTLDRIEPGASLRGKVEDALAAAIISGEMPPGEMFSAPNLAITFNVSATPVREAMLNLQKRGFVEAVRNKGFRVTHVSDNDLREIVAVRQLLEPPAMRQLAENFPQDRFPELRARADEIVAGARAGDLKAYLAADHAFHLGLLELLGNRLLVEVVADLRSRTRLTGLATLLKTEQLDRSAGEHHELLDLLAASDGQGAHDVMMRHIGHAVGWWAGRPEKAADDAAVPSVAL